MPDPIILFDWPEDVFRPQMRCRSKGGLCVHASGEWWSVSHQETGLRIAVFEVEASAYAFGERAIKVMDWLEVHDKKLTPEVIKALREIGSDYSDCTVG